MVTEVSRPTGNIITDFVESCREGVDLKKGTMAPTIAQQTYLYLSGLAAGLAGFVLAARLTDKKEVPINIVLSATVISFVATFFPSLWIVNESK